MSKTKGSITLDDGTNPPIELVLCNRAGKDDPTNISRTPHPRIATQISQGRSQYDDVVLPYKTTHQDTWESGRGEDDFERDTSRFLDSMRVHTEHENQIILGGLETYTSGLRNQDQDLPGDISFQPILGSDLYIARKFTASASYSTGIFLLWLKKIGSPSGKFKISLHSDSGGDPGTQLIFLEITIDDDFPSGERGTSSMYPFVIWYGLTASTVYWIKITQSTGTPDTSNHIEVGVEKTGGGNTKYSANDSSWSAATYDMYFRAVDQTDIRGRFLEYKRGQYFLTQPKDGSGSKLYLNGDRGAASSGSSSTLVDSTKTWQTNEWAGCRVMIIEGTGSNANINWTTVISNNGTTLTTTTWEIAPAAGSAYVILGSNTWQAKYNFTYYVTDFAVGGGAIFFAQGESNNLVAYYGYVDSSNAWIENVKTQNYKAKYLEAIYHPSAGVVLWGGHNEHPAHGIAASKALIPPLFGESVTSSLLYRNLGTLLKNGEIWDELNVTNVTPTRYEGNSRITLAASFTTGLAASKKLSNAVDIRPGTGLAMLIRSSENATLGKLQLELDDTQRVGDSFLPEGIFHLDNGVPPNIAVYFDGTTYFPISALTDRDRTTQSPDMPMTATAYIYLGFLQRVNRLVVDVVTPNANTSTLSGEKWDGKQWAAMSGFTDGTADTGKTFARDGEINWTIPNKWSLGMDATTGGNIANYENYYWIRLKVNNTLSAAVLSKVHGENDSVALQDYVNLARCKDGDTNIGEIVDFTTEDYFVVLHPEKFNQVYWTMGSTINSVASTMVAKYFNGSVFATLTLTSDGTKPGSNTLAQSGAMTWNIPDDWEPITIQGVTGYAVRFYLSSASDLTPALNIQEITVQNIDSTTLDIPALTANVWQWVVFQFSASAFPSPDHSQLISVGLRIASSFTPETYIDIGSDILIINHYPEYIPLGTSDQITNIVPYGETQQNPWYMTEGKPIEIQTENNDQPVPLALDELLALRSSLNGKAVTTSDVYLVFNLGPHIERLYQHTLDDIGLNRDEGLPTTRKGNVSSLVSYPGKIFAATDAGAGYKSTIHVRRGGGWHEMYRAPLSERIYDMYVQEIPGDINRLWFMQGSDLVWIPLPSDTYNPYKDDNYTYTHEGYIVTGWISAGFLDIAKLEASIKLFTEGLGGTQAIIVEYQLDNGLLTDAWTQVANAYTTSPFQEELLSSSYNVQARRIRFRIRLFTGDRTTTPMIKAWVLEQVLRFPVKSQITAVVRLEDEPQYYAGADDKLTRAEDISTLMETWEDSATVITLTSELDVIGTRRVIFEPAGYRPYYVDQGSDQEKHLADLRLLEV